MADTSDAILPSTGQAFTPFTPRKKSEPNEIVAACTAMVVRHGRKFVDRVRVLAEGAELLVVRARVQARRGGVPRAVAVSGRGQLRGRRPAQLRVHVRGGEADRG